MKKLIFIILFLLSTSLLSKDVTVIKIDGDQDNRFREGSISIFKKNHLFISQKQTNIIFQLKNNCITSLCINEIRDIIKAKIFIIIKIEKNIDNYLVKTKVFDFTVGDIITQEKTFPTKEKFFDMGVKNSKYLLGIEVKSNQKLIFFKKDLLKKDKLNNDKKENLHNKIIDFSNQNDNLNKKDEANLKEEDNNSNKNTSPLEEI